MVESTIHTFTYDNGEIQKVQCVRADSFEQLDFFSPEHGKDAFEHLYRLYRDYIIHKYEHLMGTVILFQLPAGVELPFEDEYEAYGKVFDPLAIVTINFRNNIFLSKGKIAFKDQATEELFERLEKRGALHILKGRRNYVSILPVSHRAGFLSQSHRDSSLRVNGSFFIMDQLDCVSVFDQIGTPFGLKMKYGAILSPPLFDREALLVYKDGSVKIGKPSLSEISVMIDGTSYRHGENASFFARPENKKTPPGGFDVVIVEDRIVSVKKGGKTPIPASGFILHLPEAIEVGSGKVRFAGLEDCSFAVQVGNSAIIDGKKTEGFTSSFYKLFHPFQTPYPPSMYPHNYKKDRAPRIVLGADAKGRPVLLWLEGAGKFGYEKGKESCGASLREAADIAEKLGLYNGIHLDGGGSAQVLVKENRYLKLSDRDPADYSESERAIPSALYIR